MYDRTFSMELVFYLDVRVGGLIMDILHSLLLLEHAYCMCVYQSSEIVMNHQSKIIVSYFDMVNAQIY